MKRPTPIWGWRPNGSWSDQAITRTTPVLLALFALVTVPALQVSQGGQIPLPATAWCGKAELTFVDYLSLGPRHL